MAAAARHARGRCWRGPPGAAAAGPRCGGAGGIGAAGSYSQRSLPSGLLALIWRSWNLARSLIETAAQRGTSRADVTYRTLRPGVNGG